MSQLRILKNPLQVPQPAEDSLHGFILRNVQKYGNATFLVEYESGKEHSYHSFADDCLRLGKGLQTIGFVEGDVFLVYGYNCYELYVTFIAGLAAGGIVVSVRGQDTYYELERECELRSPKWVFIQRELMDSARKLSDVKKDLKIFLFDVSESSAVQGFNTVRQLITENNRLEEKEIYRPRNVRKTTAVILESSGTTGPMKGALLSHYSLAAMFQGPRRPTQEDPQMKATLVTSPMAHLTGISMAYAPGIHGERAIILREFKLDKVVDAIDKYKVTMAMFSPTTINYLAKSDQIYDAISKVKTLIVGGSRTLPEAMAIFLKKYKPPTLIQGYAMTETVGLVSGIELTAIDGVKVTYDCVGKVWFHMEVKIVDTKTGQMLGPNESGEIHVRTPFMFLGYHNDPERTKATLDEEGWCHTGDIGYYTEDENLYIVDRIKDLIEQRGYHFPPADLEDILVKHEAVRDVCCVGIPEEGAEVPGDLAHAFVIPKEGMEVTEGQLKTYLNERISGVKRLLGEVHFVADFPLTAFGKVKRHVLRQNYLNSKCVYGEKLNC